MKKRIILLLCALLAALLCLFTACNDTEAPSSGDGGSSSLAYKRNGSKITFGETRERFYVMIFDNTMKMLAYETLSEGSQSEVEVNIEQLVQVIFRYSGANYILAHNHPGGTALPSDEDIAITKRIYSITAPLNKRLLEHLVIAKDRYVPIMQLCRKRGYGIF